MTGDPLDRIATRLSLYGWFPLTRDERDALVEVARAAREIRDTAKWYADNDQRLPQEVDHALCVEVYVLADAALARLDGGQE